MILITYIWGLTININSSVYNFNNPLVISRFTIVHGVNKPTNITGGPTLYHIEDDQNT